MAGLAGWTMMVMGWGGGCGEGAGAAIRCSLQVCGDGGGHQAREEGGKRADGGAIGISAWTAESEVPWVWSSGAGSRDWMDREGLGPCRAGFKSWSKGLQEQVSSGVRCPGWRP